MAHSSPAPKGAWFNNRTYDFLKNMAQLYLPALGTLYFSLATIWGLPKADEIVGTIVAIDTFLGVILKLSAKSYPGDGDIVVQRDRTGEIERYSMELNTPAEDLAGKEAVTFKVKEEDQ